MRVQRLGDPDCATAGHAVSTDLIRWEVVADDIVNDSPPSFDQTATWTGSVVQSDDHRWYMFDTGSKPVGA